MSRATRILVAMFAAGLCGAPLAEAQEAKKAAAGEKVFVAFRMENWTSKHMHDASKVKKHVETLKTLGCEVKTASHGGHTDVTCRTQFWKSLSLDTHEQAHQWVVWLKRAGFETVHGHSAISEHKHDAGGKHLEIVQYRLSNWNSQHVHNNDQLGEFTAIFRALGCEIESSSHNGHTDLKKRCPEWMEAEFPDHAAAHTWMNFLKQQGFETKHEH